MKCWVSAFCGIAVVVILLVVAIITLILSQDGFSSTDECAVGTIPCSTDGSAGICVPRTLVCDGHIDCPNGRDETMEYCVDILDATHFLNYIDEANGTTHNENACNITGFPEGCECKKETWLLCEWMNLTRVPQGVSHEITRMKLPDNRIVLHSDSFSEYDLQMIHLEGNNLTQLPNKVFRGQVHLKILFLNKNQLTHLDADLFHGLSNLRWLFLDDNKLQNINLTMFESLDSLKWLELSRNLLTLEGEAFPSMLDLEDLSLEGNHIRTLEEFTFRRLESLVALRLRENLLEHIDPRAFRELGKLKALDLSMNRLRSLDPDVFTGLKQLDKLNLGNNPIHCLSNSIFVHLGQLRSLNLTGIDIENIDVTMFSALQNLEFVYFKKFKYCTFAPAVPKCRPKSDGISSFKHLLVKPVLRVTVWAVAGLTCLGNALVLGGRCLSRDDHPVLSVFIRNLAAADLLMSVYLFVIGDRDHQFRGEYNHHAQKWMTSWGCTAIGILAMASSEVSMLILAFMSLERFIFIACPYGDQKLSRKSAYLSLAVIWIVGFVLAIIPVIQWRQATRFYGSTGLCFPLHIDDPYVVGWQYSTFVFLGLNGCSLLLIFAVYLGLFANIRRTRRATPLSVGDMELAVRLFFIVFTDCLCWAPIALLKCLALAGIEIPPDIHAWVVVFILPVNSAVNPFLYTFTTTKFRSQFERIGHKLCPVRWDMVVRRTSSSAETEETRSTGIRGWRFADHHRSWWPWTWRETTNSMLSTSANGSSTGNGLAPLGIRGSNSEIDSLMPLQIQGHVLSTSTYCPSVRSPLRPSSPMIRSVVPEDSL